MTRLSILFAMLLHALPHPMVPQDGRASIEGIVVQDTTGKPVAMASVELTVVEGPKVISRTTTSGDDGSFSFKDLPAGEGYQIVVTGTGLWPTAYGQRRSYGPWTPITLSAGQHFTDVRIAARAITQLSGKIVDSMGRPQIGASVLAMRATYVEGRREIQRSSNTVTNLRGEYNFQNLPPGWYYVRVSPRNEPLADTLFTNPALHDRRAAAGSANNVKEVEGYPILYYPGGPIESAKAIPLGDGEVIEGIDITVTKSSTARVRGAVIHSGTGKKIGAAQVTLLPIGSSPDSNWGRFFNAKDGSFDLRAVLPGKYVLNAIVEQGERTLAGRVAVEIRNGEAKTFDVRVAPVSDIAGRFVLEGQGGTAPDFSAVSVSLLSNTPQPVDGTLSRARSKLPSSLAAVKPDGSFTLPGVVPWDYRVVVSEISGAYVKAVRYADKEVLVDGLRLEGVGSLPMEIVLATDGGRLDGRILEGKKSRVVVVPEQRHRHDLYLAVTSSDTGRFQLTNIPPGRYKVFAWQNPVEGAWTDPDYLERYEDRGAVVDISSEDAEYVEIREIPAL